MRLQKSEMVFCLFVAFVQKNTRTSQARDDWCFFCEEGKGYDALDV